MYMHVLLQTHACSPVGFPLNPPQGTVNQQFSGVARLGRTDAHALVTRGGAPPVQVSMHIISADVDRVSGTERS